MAQEKLRGLLEETEEEEIVIEDTEDDRQWRLAYSCQWQQNSLHRWYTFG
jgi:hypothetical protein